MTQRSRVRPYHAFLLAAFPVLFLYAQNLEEGVTAADTVRPLLLTVGAATLLTAAGTLALRSAQRAGLLVSALILLFFSYGHVLVVLEGSPVRFLARHQVLLAVWALLGLGALAAARWAGAWLPGLTRGLNVVAGALVAMNLAIIGLDAVRSAGEPGAAAPTGGGGTVRPTGGERDVIYIILDRYAGARTLEKYYGYDNEPFLDALRERGFYVPEETWGNYPRSTHSMASSLNMTYLDHLRDQPGGDLRPLTRMYDGPRVARFLKARGYRYVNIGTWWEVTRSDPYADVNVRLDVPSRFEQLLWETTLLQPVSERFGWFKGSTFRQTEYRRVPFQFRKIAEHAADPQPSFIFAHLLLPHDPFIFDEDGRFLRARDVRRRSTQENYLGQLRYANREVLELFDRLLAGPPEDDPIIILQSDEGPEPLGPPGRVEDWASASTATLEQKMRILDAYHYPGVAGPGLYEGITPVNSFRVLFNAYFEAGLPLLPDRTYAYRNAQDQYSFVDITERMHATG